jgi:integrase/recombinase XerD
MLTPKVILYKHKTYADGSHPIIIQVIKEGKAVRKVIGKCLANEWLKTKNRVSSKNIRYTAINDDIDNALINFGLLKKESFFEFYQRYIDEAKLNQQASVYLMNSLIHKQLKEFSPNADFNKMDESFFKSFAAYIGKTNKKNTVRTKMQNIAKIIKEAVKSGIINKNPMEYLTFPKEKTFKSKLNISDLRKLMEVELKGTMDEVRDIFLASIYMRGIRIGDALTMKEDYIKDGRIIFREGKTGKIVNIAIIPELQSIFDKWKGKNNAGYIFSLLRVPKKFQADKMIMKKDITACILKVNYHLSRIAVFADIDKKITSHTARHSFSVLARTTIKDTTITKDLVGHSSLSVHELYISEISDNTILDIYASQILDQLK